MFFFWCSYVMWRNVVNFCWSILRSCVFCCCVYLPMRFQPITCICVAGGRSHGAVGAYWGSVAACEERPRPTAGPAVSGEPLPPRRATAWWDTHTSCSIHWALSSGTDSNHPSWVPRSHMLKRPRTYTSHSTITQICIYDWQQNQQLFHEVDQ